MRLFILCGTALYFLFGVSTAVLAQEVASSSNPDETYYHQTGPLRGSLIADKPVPLYSNDPKDPWNEIYHLLFTYENDSVVSSYYEREDPNLSGPLEVRPDENGFRGRLMEEFFKRFSSRIENEMDEKYKTVKRLEGGDVPHFFVQGDVNQILQEARYLRLRELMQSEIRQPSRETHSLMAHVLFQQDLWERFDTFYRYALYGEGYVSGRVQYKRLLELKGLIGQLLAKISPSKEELKSIPSNYPQLAKAFAELDPDMFQENSPWLTVLPNADEGILMHSRLTRERKVFKSFLRLPDPTDQKVREGFASGNHFLPMGSKVIILEYLVGISGQGELVPLPFIEKVQVREVKPVTPGADGVYGLDDLSFHVFHAKRLAVSRGVTPTFERLKPDDPVPLHFQFGSQDRVPMRMSCIQCHHIDGSNYMTPGAADNPVGVPDRLLLPPGDSTMSKRVIREKSKEDNFKALQKFFR